MTIYLQILKFSFHVLWAHSKADFQYCHVSSFLLSFFIILSSSRLKTPSPIKKPLYAPPFYLSFNQFLYLLLKDRLIGFNDFIFHFFVILVSFRLLIFYFDSASKNLSPLYFLAKQHQIFLLSFSSLVIFLRTFALLIFLNLY